MDPLMSKGDEFCHDIRELNIKAHEERESARERETLLHTCALRVKDTRIQTLAATRSALRKRKKLFVLSMKWSFTSVTAPTACLLYSSVDRICVKRGGRSR